MSALNHLVFIYNHIIAQIIEAVFVICSICYVGVVCGLLFGAVAAVYHEAYRQPQIVIYFSHPFAVAFGQIIVHCNNMHAFFGERVQISGKRCGKRFSFACLHFRDPSLMQNYSAYKLYTEMPHAENSAGGLADNGKSVRKNVVGSFARGKA
ncbi:hypothetical protein SDC9_124477 [bioreactor metagenome]|uniref:Uncharacterized protein n=1 Tax=bioreactor metagenome TaxID=1076179 RepID=A0A645CKK5_9ZZZZ